MPDAVALRHLARALILGCCLAPHAAPATPSTYLADPEYLIDTWEAEDGLPENSATGIAFGPGGFLWFGTWNGLVRFDGVEFTVLRPDTSPGLPGPAIINLHADRRDRLWVSTGDGLATLHGSTWRPCGTGEGWVGSYVRTFSDCPDGEVLFTTFDGRILESAGDRVRELPRPPGEPDQGYLGAVDDQGRRWVAQNRFVGFLQNGRWIQVRDLPPSLPRAEVNCAPARGGGLWVLLGRELVLFQGTTEARTVTLPTHPGGVWSMKEDLQSNLWFCSFDSGLLRLASDGSIRRWNHTTGLRAQGIRALVEDTEGNLWVGTSGGGLSRFRPRRALDATRGTVLADRHCRSIAPSSAGGLWVASSELGLFHRTTNALERIALPKARAPGQGSGIYGLAVLEDRAGRIWYGEKDGLWCRRPGGDFERVAAPWTGDVYLRSIFETSAGHVWFAGGQGALQFDGERFRPFGVKDGLPASNGIVFTETAQNQLWLALDKGLYQFGNQRFTEVRTAEGAPIPEVMCFLPEADGTLWMGTRSLGLLRWRNGHLDRVGPRQGYPVASVHAILDDGRGHLWMPSHKGLVRAARADLHAMADARTPHPDLIVIDRQDGLPGLECSFSQPACARDPSGDLWFATQRGIGWVRPDGVRRNPVAPPLHILRLRYHPPMANRSTDGPEPLDFVGPGSKSIELTAPFPVPPRLPPGSFAIEFGYTAPSFSAPERLRFQTPPRRHQPAMGGRGHPAGLPLRTSATR